MKKGEKVISIPSKKEDTNIVCPFCGGKIKELPENLNLKNIIKIAEKIKENLKKL